MGILNNAIQPSNSEAIKRIMHQTYQEKTGDWSLYQNYIEIKVYGCELAPYKLPKYLPMSIFSLEYIRQMLNSNDIHFVVEKKKSRFRIET